MADMTEQAKKTDTEPKVKENKIILCIVAVVVSKVNCLFVIKVRRDDLEEEDDIESYVRHMKEKGIVIGKTGRSTQRDEVSWMHIQRTDYDGFTDLTLVFFGGG